MRFEFVEAEDAPEPDPTVDKRPRDPDAYAYTLLAAATALAHGTRAKLKLGDLLVLQPGLRNARVPAYEEPVVFLQYLPEPIFPSAGTLQVYRFDAVAGALDPEGDLVEILIDTRRFSILDRGGLRGAH